MSKIKMNKSAVADVGDFPLYNGTPVKSELFTSGNTKTIWHEELAVM